MRDKAYQGPRQNKIKRERIKPLEASAILKMDGMEKA